MKLLILCPKMYNIIFLMVLIIVTITIWYSIITKIYPKNSFKCKIDTNSIQSENAIILKYKDNKGNTYEEYIVGYLEKGFSGSANITIVNITENGKLDMNIK